MAVKHIPIVHCTNRGMDDTISHGNLPHRVCQIVRQIHPACISIGHCCYHIIYTYIVKLWHYQALLGTMMYNDLTTISSVDDAIVSIWRVRRVKNHVRKCKSAHLYLQIEYKNNYKTKRFSCSHTYHELLYLLSQQFPMETAEITIRT